MKRQATLIDPIDTVRLATTRAAFRLNPNATVDHINGYFARLDRAEVCDAADADPRVQLAILRHYHEARLAEDDGLEPDPDHKLAGVESLFPKPQPQRQARR